MARGTPGGRRRRGRSAVAAALAALVTVTSACGTIAVSTPTPTTATTTMVPLSGSLGIHDPALVVDSGGRPWLVYGTGDARVGVGAPRILSSADGGATWAYAGTAWDKAGDPSWVRAKYTTLGNYWAPALYQHDGTWYLYYAASGFGKNTSSIGLLTGTSPDPSDPSYGWTDRGEVIASRWSDIYNAIDPTIIEDDAGVPWLFFGSFWTGIYVVQLEWPSGHVAPGAVPAQVAGRKLGSSAIEAPAVIVHDGYYYLFVSWDTCCKGVNSTYNIRVGRSESVTGPYVDRDGAPLATGGGTLWLEGAGDVIGPGGQSLAGDYLAFHYYNRVLQGAPTLALAHLGWDDGWPLPPGQ